MTVNREATREDRRALAELWDAGWLIEDPRRRHDGDQ